MALINLTGWAETDPNGKIVVDGAQEVTITDLKRNESAHLDSPQYPADTFDGDFGNEVIHSFTKIDNRGFLAPWLMSDANDDYQGLVDNGDPFFAITGSVTTGGTRQIVLVDNDVVTNSDNTQGVFAWSDGVDVELFPSRDISVGAFGTLYGRVYEGGILKDILALTLLNSIKNYRRLQTATSRDAAVNAGIDGHLTKFDDGLPSAINATPPHVFARVR